MSVISLVQFCFLSELISPASKIFSTLMLQESMEEKSFIDIKEEKDGCVMPGILNI